MLLLIQNPFAHAQGTDKGLSGHVGLAQGVLGRVFVVLAAAVVVAAGSRAALHDFVQPHEVRLLHGGFHFVGGLEVDVHALHVMGGEVFLALGALGVEGDVERAPVAQLHALAVQQPPPCATGVSPSPPPSG